MEAKKFLIIDSRPYGLFSIFLHTVDNIMWAKENDYVPVVRWGPGRTDVNLNRPGAEKATQLGNPVHVGASPNFSTSAKNSEKSPCLYADTSKAMDPTYSCWEHFFEKVSNVSLPSALAGTYEESDIFQVGFHDLDPATLNDKFLIYNLHSYTPLNLWMYCYLNRSGLLEHRRKVGEVIREAVRPTTKIMNKVETFARDYFSDNMIGVHVRGTDKASESKIGQRPTITIDDYLRKLRSLIRKNPEATLFIASDNNESIRVIFENFPDNKKVVYTCTRMSTYDSAVPVHLTEAANSQLGQEALIDCLLLSKCDNLVCTDSNLAAAAAYFNPESKIDFVNIKE